MYLAAAHLLRRRELDEDEFLNVFGLGVRELVDRVPARRDPLTPRRRPPRSASGACCRKEALVKRAQLYVSSIGEDCCESARTSVSGSKLAQFCTAARLDGAPPEPWSAR